MRETVGSLRAYFILVGIIGVARGIIVIGNESNPVDMKVSAGIDLALAAAFLIVGVLLKKLLRDSPGLVKGLLYAAAALQVAVAVVLLALHVNPVSLVAPAIALLIFWYLLVNVNRLSRLEKPPEAA